MKKILFLGGSRYLIPAIKAAHNLGAYVITCDYLPDNIAHKYSDEYHNISIIDKEAVLELSKQLEIDGILSFATDPGVITESFVANTLGLPASAPYESVCIMQNKALFRDFLKKNGFNVPVHKAFATADEAKKDIGIFTFPVVVKPVDSSGSRGVKKVYSINELDSAIEIALENSLSGRFIIEEFIEMKGSQSGSDSFVSEGKLVFASFDRQYYDKESENPFTPSAMCYPADMPIIVQQALREEIQRLVTLLKIRSTIINVECRLGKDGKVYIMEVTPRAGGNRVPEVISMASGTDIIANNVKAALGYPVDKMTDPIYDGSYARVVIHSKKAGVFNAIKIDGYVEREYLIDKDMFIERGDKVESFSGANKSMGLLILHFPNIEVANRYLSDIDRWIELDIE